MHAAQHPLAGRAQRPLLSLSDFSLARAPHDLRRAPDAPPARRARSAAGCAAAATAAAPAAAAPRPAATAAAAGPLRFPPEYYDGPGRLMLKCLTLPELEAWCASVGEDGRRRGAQLWRWMYADSVAWRAGAGAAPRWLAALDDAPAPAVQNGFSAAFRAKFAALATLDGGLALERVSAAADGTRKMVFRLTAGPAAGATVETVVIPITREAGAKARVTLCVSSQAGCAMGCTFCYTGTLGLLGNLTPGQIVEQVVAARRLLFDAAAAEGSVAPAASPITNVVYMGMGEPLDNLQAVLPSLEVLAHPLGLHLSHNKITVSTVGLIPALRRLAAESRAGVAVSLHGVTDAQRSAIVPVNRRHPLGELVGALEELFPRDRAAPGFGRHVLIEYTMLAGVNDAPADAAALAALLARVRCKVNLIEFNPHAGTAFTASPPAALAAFRDVLVAAGMVATVRCSRGDDEMAACGQLGDAGARAARRAVAEARAGAAL